MQRITEKELGGIEKPPHNLVIGQWMCLGVSEAEPSLGPNDLCGKAQGQRGWAVPTPQSSQNHLLLSADLVSVVAIFSKLGRYQSYSLNAVRCLKYSSIQQWKPENTPSLQKFIAAVYQTQRSRYEKMNYLSKESTGAALGHVVLPYGPLSSSRNLGCLCDRGDRGN